MDYWTIRWHEEFIIRSLYYIWTWNIYLCLLESSMSTVEIQGSAPKQERCKCNAFVSISKLNSIKFKSIKRKNPIWYNFGIYQNQYLKKRLYRLHNPLHHHSIGTWQYSHHYDKTIVHHYIHGYMTIHPLLQFSKYLKNKH